MVRSQIEPPVRRRFDTKTYAAANRRFVRPTVCFDLAVKIPSISVISQNLKVSAVTLEFLAGQQHLLAE
jgi:hypothetical protein